MVETPRLDVRAIALLAIAFFAPAADAQPDRFVPHQVIVKFAPATPLADAVSLRASVGATVARRFATIDAELWEMTGIGVPEAVGRLKSDRRIEYIEPNYIVQAVDLFPNDPRFATQWNLHNTGQTNGTADADIDAPEAWSLRTGGDVLVGVIDTGVDWRHEDLAASIFVNTREIPDNRSDDDGNGFIDDVRGWDFVNEDNDPDDDNGHGTHVAGTIAAIGNNGVGVTGVAWTARILPLKFMSAIGFGSTSDAIRAVEYATMMGVRLTNNSWGGIGFSRSLRDAVEAARDANIMFVAAAGNAGLNTDVTAHYPSGLDVENVISVGSTDHNDERSIFSNYGVASVDLGAPGTDVVSTYTDDRYAIASGTSMAAPHVAGAVCLLWSVAPSLTYAEVKQAILSSVDPIPALQGFTVTGGRLNIHRMFSGIDDIPPAPVEDLAVSSTGSSTVVVAWTATGDDGEEGSAYRYDLRYSTSPIDASNFDVATSAGELPSPEPSGAAESFEVSGLDFETTYYFAMVVADELANRSSPSGAASGTTLGAPALEFEPGAFAADLLTGGVSTQFLAIRNTAEGTLDFALAGLPSWVRAEPPAGRVLAGQSVDVGIVMDATGLFAGDYQANARIQSNDPARPSAPIEVSLHVTNAPDVAVAPAEVDFGLRYTGTCANLIVVISNIGTESLTVNDISIANPEFSIDPGAFALGVGEERELTLTFCPLSEEAVPGIPRRYPRRSRGVLTIDTNDPDRPRYTVPLYGEGIDPPVVVVTPNAFSENLLTGGVAERVLTVSNAGASGLDFEITLEELGVAAARIDAIADPSLSPNVIAAGRELSRDEMTALATSLPASVTIGAGVDKDAPSQRRSVATPRVLDRVEIDNLEEVFGSDQYEFLGGPRTRGNLFTCTTATTLLEHRFYMNPSAPTQMWFVVYEGEEQTGVYQLISASNVSPAGPGLGWYSSGDISVPLRAGKYYLLATAFEDATTYYNAQGLDPFPVPASFGTLTAAAGWTWQPFDQFPPAPFQFVTADAFAAPVAYYQTLVTGSAIRWLALAAEEGSLAPEASMDVAIRFDATGVAGGDYQGNIRIASNDPVTPEVVIPANLRVTGAPDIGVSETAIDFGTAFVGTTVEDTLIVSNTGTEFLFVSAITSNLPAYSVDAPSFALAPGTRRHVVVTFAPTVAGSFPAVLSIASIDPDEPTIEVALNGDAREAPMISVDPASLSVDIASGESAVPVLVIANTGGSDLAFEIDIALAPPRVAAGNASIPRSSGVFARGDHPVSIGPVPTTRDPRRPVDRVPALAAVTGRFGFATETQNRSATRLDLEAPETLDFLGHAPENIWAGDFGIGDNAFAYAVDELNRFMTIDTLTGTQTMLGTLTPFANEVWSGMALDPTTGTMYLTSTNTAQSSLYVLDVDGPAATRVGAIGYPAVVALAVDGNGDMFALDVTADELVAVDKATGAGTKIGSLGFDSNFGQGMAFDPVSDRLYISAFDNFRFQSELRVADRTTGATTVVGLLGAIEPGGLVQLGWLGIPGLGGVPWLRANPRRGVVAPGTSFDVDVHFDAARLNGGEYDASLRVVSNDPALPGIVVPAHLRVTGIPDIDASASSIDFGPVFVGGSARRTLSVANTGTDLLIVRGIAAGGDYVLDATSFTLAPGASRLVGVTFAPSAAGPRPSSLTIASNDPDESAFVLSLAGEGREPPVISVLPESFEESLLTGLSAARTLTVDNSAGAADLVWNVSTRYPGDARAVVATSPAFRGRAMVDPFKEATQRPRGRPAPGDLFTFPWEARASASGVEATRLETILVSLDANYEDVTATIPERWEIFDGKVSDGILDGGYDMYDGGNYLATNFGGYIPYSDGVIVAGSYFGGSGRYFTRKYSGLFVLVAETDGVEYFEIDGNLGADGEGEVDGAILEARTAGADFRGFVKRVHGAGDPSVNHLIIVQENDAASHEFATTTHTDYHRAFGLQGGRRLYYLLYAGWDGFYIDDQATLNIMGAFLNSIGLSPTWLRVTPGAGVVPAGESASVGVVFNAAGLEGDYGAHIVVASNDPLAPEVVVPSALHVSPAPDIVVSSAVLRYAPTFVGATATDTLAVSNIGRALLTVTDIVSSAADFFADTTNFALAPGESRRVSIAFAPTIPGTRTSLLTIVSDDPDQAAAHVLMIGEGREAPVVSVEPASLADSLVAGESVSHTLRISNSGGHPLDLRVTIEGARDVPGMPPIGGGPDFFGYRWEDSNHPEGPAFEWIDAAGGTEIALAGDDFVSGVPLGFAFRYYGWVYSSIGVSSNGWLSFNGAGSTFPDAVPRRDFYAGAIAPYARDLFPPGGTVRYQTIGVAPDRRFVVEFHDVPDLGGENRKTFEVILYERTNAIRFQYLVAPNDPVGFGIESPDESLGLGNGGTGDTFMNPARVEDGYAIEFIAPPAWLGVEPAEVSVPPGGGVDVVVTMDAEDLARGNYPARLNVRSNDPITPRIVIPVALKVDAPMSTTDIAERALPTRYELHPNRPNPFNPTTTIAYDMPSGGDVRLVVYDVRGGEVRELVRRHLPAGRHQATWDGRNDRREPVASGVYFYRLVVGDFVRTKKMVLLK